MVGSYATGNFVVPYSDIDVLAVAGDGDGPAVRDAVVAAARSMEDTVCVTIDPFSDEAIVYSILTIGLQIDWFIVERGDGGRERTVWRGTAPQPIDIACRAWSSLLYTVALLLKDDSAKSRASAARDLAEHWVWLSAHGIDVSPLPAVRPDADDDLFGLIGATTFHPLEPLGEIQRRRRWTPPPSTPQSPTAQSSTLRRRRDRRVILASGRDHTARHQFARRPEVVPAAVPAQRLPDPRRQRRRAHR